MDVLVTDFRGLRFMLRRVDDCREQFTVTRLSDGHALTSKLYMAEVRNFFDALVDEWVADRLGVTEPAKVRCVSCDVVLEPVHTLDTDYQFDNALWIRFSGGYAMFIDPCGDPDPEAVLCHRCAHELCDTFEWAARLLEPGRSHAHRSADGADLIRAGHDGWDLVPTRLDGGLKLERHLVDTHRVDRLPDGVRERWALHFSLHNGAAIDHRHVPADGDSFDDDDVDDVVDGVGPI